QRAAGHGFDFFGTQHGGRVRPEPARDGGREHPGAQEDVDAPGGTRAQAVTEETAAADGTGAQETPGAEATRDGRERGAAGEAPGQDAAADGPAADRAGDRADDAGPEVIDLTEHDDTEQLELRGLRSALGS
ncbi:hypothetical protein L1885_27310, partial [Streptomyces fuscigenes]|nr:hypothetical protein [Streptomyces fuscigenes]